MSQATLENLMPPECVNQFPLTPDNGVGTVCFIFDNWVLGPISLPGGYEMVAGAEGWMEQNEKQVAALIPIAAVHRGTNQLKINGYEVQDMHPAFYEASEVFWGAHANLKPGDILYVPLVASADAIASEFVDDFGFEAAEFTEADLIEFYKTGDLATLGGYIWPTPRIVGMRK